MAKLIVVIVTPTISRQVGGGDLGSPFSRAVNNDEIRIDGGTGWNDGASLSLSGKNRTDANGNILLHTTDGTNTSELLLAPNGTFFYQCNGTYKNVAMQEDVNVLLNGKANSSHTHTKNQITDFPTIPSNTSQLTNDSGYITSSGSCNYANSAGYVQGNNNSANAANALLRSGSGRTDSSPEGDTWIFLDELGGSGAPWGFKHNQAANTIGFYGAGTETSSINLSNGYFSGSCNYANSAGSANDPNAVHKSGDETIDGVKTFNSDVYSTNSQHLWFRHLDGSNNGGMDGCLFLNYTNNAKNVYFNGNSYYINGGYYNGRAENAQYTYWLRTSSHTDHLFHTEWDGSYFWTYVTAGDGGYRPVRVERSNSSGYADSAGNSDTLDGYHEYSFLRNRGAASASGEGTLWAQIGIKEYYNALPDGLNDVYGYGETVSLAGTSCRFDIYCSHNSSNGNGLYYRSGWNDDKKAWRCFIDSANIGSQSVNYATNSGYTNWLRTSSHTDHLFHTEWDGTYFWTYVTASDGGYRAVRVERSNSSGYADSCTEAAYMGQYETITYGVNRLQYFNSPTSTTSGAANIANPYNDWFYHLLMSHGNGQGYYGDLALCFHSNTLAFRRIVAGGDQGWTYLVKNGRTIVSGYEVYVG